MAERAAAWCLVLSVCAGGCSVVTMDRLGGGYRPERSPRCSASELPPVMDAVGGSYYVALLVRELRGEGEEALQVDWGDAGFQVGMAAIWYAAMLYGWRQVNRCSAARDAHDRWLDQTGGRSVGGAALEGGGDAR